MATEPLETFEMPDNATLSIKINGVLTEVGKRFRDFDGKLRVVWSVPTSRVKHEIIYLTGSENDAENGSWRSARLGHGQPCSQIT